MSNESLPVLYSFKRCPYAIRARVALAFAQIDYIHREISLKDKHPEFLKTSPKGTVPVLVDSANNRVFDESYDIVTHALTTRLPVGWRDNRVLDLPLSETIYRRLLQEAIPAIRSIKYDSGDHAGSTDQVNQYLKMLDDLLAQQRFLHEQPSALDLLVFPNLRQLTIHDPNWLSTHAFTNVALWLQCWTLHPVFKKIFVTQPVWHERQPPIVIDNQHNYAVF